MSFFSYIVLICLKQYLLILRDMSKIDEIINFLTNDLNIKISNKKIDLINNKFYPDINNKNYWSINIYERTSEFFYEGIITKDEYEKIKILAPDTHILFEYGCNNNDDEGDLSEISFIDDVKKIKELYDKGFKKSITYFDLIDYLYENEILKKSP
jgi:hypothetical protein